jgi:hypothetical protein
LMSNTLKKILVIQFVASSVKKVVDKSGTSHWINVVTCGAPYSAMLCF